MPYFINTIINQNKKIKISFKNIYGLGQSSIKKMCRYLGIKTKIVFKELTPILKIKIRYFIEKNYITGEDLKLLSEKNIKNLITIKSFRGSRILFNLPNRGQRTRTNAKTSKKKF